MLKELAATAASRLRAPKLQALQEFYVQCSSITPAGAVWSSLRRAAAGEGAEAHDLQSGVVAMCSSARVSVGEGAEARSSANSGRPGALLHSSVAFGSGCG